MSRSLATLRILALGAAVALLAAAPAARADEKKPKPADIDVVLCLDVSNSMAATLWVQKDAIMQHERVHTLEMKTAETLVKFSHRRRTRVGEFVVLQNDLRGNYWACA